MIMLSLLRKELCLSWVGLCQRMSFYIILRLIRQTMTQLKSILWYEQSMRLHPRWRQFLEHQSSYQICLPQSQTSCRQTKEKPSWMPLRIQFRKSLQIRPYVWQTKIMTDGEKKEENFMKTLALMTQKTLLIIKMHNFWMTYLIC